MAATEMVHVRVKKRIKTQAAKTLAAMGLSVSDAVRVLLTRVAAEKSLPFNPLPPLDLGEASFLANRSIKDLAQLQRVKPLKDMAVLAGGIPDDDDVGNMIEEIYAARK